ncbi:reverse transcriptase domain-containing protein [Tanacetum coccineum]
MEEMLNKFIDEGKREHEEMRAFIYDFQTNNKLLFKERNNLLIELRFRVQELLNVINNVPMIDCEVKGVTTRGGKTTTQDVHNNNTNGLPKEPVVVEPEKPAEPNKVLTNDQPQITNRSVGRSLQNHHERKMLCHLGASISLMPYTMYKKLGLGEPKATRMSLELADRSIQYPRGIIKNILVKVDKFVLPIDFVILDMPEDSRVPIILGRPFLETARAMIDVFNKKITLIVGDDEVIFDVDQSIKRPTTEDDECYGIDDLDETINEEAQELLANEELDLFLSRGLEKSINQSDLKCCESTSSNEKNGADSKNSIRRIDSANTPYPVTQGTTNGDDVKSEHLYSASANEIDEKKPELNNLPQHLEYAYLHGDKSFPIIISSKLSEREKISLLQVLERRKGAIAWKMLDIKGISPSYCTYKILMEDDYKPVIQPQRRLNPKGGMTVVLNDNNELIPSGTVTGWRVCNDYCKLNDATRKDHFPLPLIDQMLERLCGNEYYHFLNGFSGFFQIPIPPEDQEKTTFTCPYGTFAYRRMPFGLCNAPATFQRCMTTIFHDMVEDFMEVFMDDFLVFEGIVLGHKISRAGIEVDRAKINVIAKLPYPTNVKGVRSFLGHAGFYRRFIKDFSMISKPMTQLLMKDAKFDFSDDCKKAFNILKEKLTTAPIIISPDWNIPFELMCDASDFAVGAVLGQRIDGKFKPIYYASKTLNNAQEHYTTTEKELLVVVFSFDKFRQYLVLSKTVVYTDHSALKYLFSKEDAKPRLIRWVLLLQGFDIEIKDKKGAENLAADHLSRLENPDLGTFTEEEITDEFPDEHLMILKAELNNDEPWYADYVNYIVRKILCSDNIMRTCVAGNEILEILGHCHSGPTEGHHSASITRRKVYESGFYWPSIFKDAKDYVMSCCKNHFMELNELMELRDEAYENTRIYKERTKKWHDSRLRGDKDFKVGDQVLLFNSRFKMHPGKLKLKWYGPNLVKTMHPYGTVEIIDKNGISFKVNGQRLKKYHDGHTNEEEKEVVELDDDTT